MKFAKIQFLGNCVRLWDAETNQDIAIVSMVKRPKPNYNFAAVVQAKAHELGYVTPSIYPGTDGVLRIWL